MVKKYNQAMLSHLGDWRAFKDVLYHAAFETLQGDMKMLKSKYDDIFGISKEGMVCQRQSLLRFTSICSFTTFQLMHTMW